MQAGVYAVVGWTPAVFWQLTMGEYNAAMAGFKAKHSAMSPDAPKAGPKDFSKPDRQRLTEIIKQNQAAERAELAAQAANATLTNRRINNSDRARMTKIARETKAKE